MDASLLSILVFVLVTVIYYWAPSVGKPHLDVATLENPAALAAWYTTLSHRLGFYLLAIIVTQFLLAAGFLATKCGGNIGRNMGAAFLFTFIPWVLLFGVLLAVLFAFPGFKTAFANVIGYFVVAWPANDLLTELLVDGNVQKAIEQTADPQRKQDLASAADAIIKICGNKSVLINQLNPDNFTGMWSLLRPLMKEGMAANADKKQQLLDMVLWKDNIGEAFWYIYAAILISSIVYSNLSTRACATDPATVARNRNAYLAQQEQQKSANEGINGVTYTAQ